MNKDDKKLMVYRNSTIEILRILSMIMIIGLHYLNKQMGGALDNVQALTLNYYIIHLFESLFIIGPNLYVLISGYYMIIKKDGVTISKVFNLYLIMVIYALIFFIVGGLIGETEFTLKNAALVFVPFLGGRRWFVETYILLYILSPFLNRLLQSLNDKSYGLLLLIQLFVFSVWPSFFPSAPILDNGYGIVNFITLYMIAGYLRRLRNRNTRLINLNPVVFLIGYIICSILTTGVSLMSERAWNYDNIINIISAVMLFQCFLNLKEKHIPVINRISSLTFGVFLIHSDFSLWHFIYHTCLHCELVYESTFLVVHMFVSIAFLFVCSAVIDYVRQLVWNPLFSKLDAHSKLLKLIIRAE